MKRSLLVYVTLLALAGGAVFIYWKRTPPGLREWPAREGTLVSLPSDTRPIRVNLTSSPRREFALSVDGGYTLRTVDGSQVLYHGNGLKPTTIVPTPDGFRIAGTEHSAPRLELLPERSPSIWIDNHQYRGTVQFHRTTNNRVTAINVVAFDDYLASVVDSEMPLDFGPAARQAQAIVARTYALYQMQRVPAAALFDVYATTRSQKYLGYQYRDKRGRRLAGESDDSRQRVRDTAGVVCTHQGQLFCTYYCAVCGGRTTQGDQVFADAVPLLDSVVCRWCKPAPLCDWQREVSKSELSRRLGDLFQSRGKPFDKLTSIDCEPPRPSGHESTFTVSDGRHSYRLKASELRTLLSSTRLHSPNFSIHEKGETLLIEGHGHGHGVGLCQWGARGMARAGKTSTEILKHYYPGVQLIRLPSEPGGAELSSLASPWEME